MFDKIKQDWEDMPRAHRWGFGGFVVFSFSALAAHAAFSSNKPPDQVVKETAAADASNVATEPDATGFHARTALPDTNRNQGLEDLSLKIDKFASQMGTRMDAMENARVTQQNTKPAGAAQGVQGALNGTGAAASPDRGVVDLDQIIQTPTFASDASGAAAGVSIKQPGGGLFAGSSADAASAVERSQARMKVWDDPPAATDGDLAELKREASSDQLVIPVNAAMESVLLSGFNARASGSVAGGVGSASTSANNVGAPFVTRLKGDAILPNGWRVSDLGDCYLGGSAVAVLSAERAYSIANQLSCIKPNGEVYEGPVKAYALDVDGTLGLACKVVSKQGSLLMQAALTGMVSGLGAALSPTSIPTYNSNGTNGSTASYQLPNPGAVAATSAGAGIQQASAQLSKFYLQYASEVFPVCEVVSTTRATWVLEETVVLHRRKDTKEASR